MGALEDDLKELSDVLPLVPAEMTRLGTSAQDLSSAAETLLNHVGSARQQMEGILQTVRSALPDFQVQMELLDKRLEGAVAAVEKAWSDADGLLEDGEATLATRGTELGQDRAELLKALVVAASRIENASTSGEEAIDRVEAVARDGAQRIKAAADAVTSEVAELKTLLERTSTSLQDGGEGLLQRFTRFVENGHFDVDVLFDHVEHRLGQYTTQLTEILKTAETQADGVILAAGRRATDNVRAPLLSASEDFRVATERLAAAANSEQGSLVTAGAAHDQALDELSLAVTPVSGGIDEIHAAIQRMRQS